MPPLDPQPEPGPRFRGGWWQGAMTLGEQSAAGRRRRPRKRGPLRTSAAGSTSIAASGAAPEAEVPGRRPRARCRAGRQDRGGGEIVGPNDVGVSVRSTQFQRRLESHRRVGWPASRPPGSGWSAPIAAPAVTTTPDWPRVTGWVRNGEVRPSAAADRAAPARPSVAPRRPEDEKRRPGGSSEALVGGKGEGRPRRQPVVADRRGRHDRRKQSGGLATRGGVDHDRLPAPTGQGLWAPRSCSSTTSGRSKHGTTTLIRSGRGRVAAGGPSRCGGGVSRSRTRPTESGR